MFLVAGEVYLNTVTSTYVMAMGFHLCTGLAVPMQRYSVQEEDLETWLPMLGFAGLIHVFLGWHWVGKYN